MKTRLSRIFLAVLVLGLGSAVAPRKAHACMCGNYSAQEALTDSDVVNFGKVVSLSQPTPIPGGQGLAETAVTFDVVTTWKGSPQARRVVYTAYTDCEPSFPVGRS